VTGASSAAGPDGGPERRWDVALSFAGVQQDYVEQVAEALHHGDERCSDSIPALSRTWRSVAHVGRPVC
jgi:hypothetical protein